MEWEVRSEGMFGTPDQNAAFISPCDELAASDLGNEWRGFEGGDKI